MFQKGRIIADFSTQYPGAIVSRKTIWFKDDTDQRRHRLGFTIDMWKESPAIILSVLGDLKF